MASGGQKRTRSERVAAIEMPPGRWERAWISLHRRDVLVRIGLAILTSLVLCAVIRGWRPPFSYRLGDVPPLDISARVAFYATDPAETEAALRRAEREVRYVYVHDPKALSDLRGAVRNRIQKLLTAAKYDQLDRAVWAEFQPPAELSPPASEAELRRRFERLHEALDGDENLARFEADLAAALAPFESRGVLDELPQKSGEGNQDEIVVFPVDGSEEPKVVKVTDVLIGNGTAVQESLRAHFPSPDVADLVFNWLRPRLAEVNTLALDETATQRAREAAAASVTEVVREFKPGQTLARAGQPLTRDQTDVLRLEHEAAMAQRSVSQRLYRAAAATAMILGLFALCGAYLHYRDRRIPVRLQSVAAVLACIVVTVIMARWTSQDPWRAEIIPLLIFGQTIAIAYRQELALLLAGVTALVVVLGLGFGLGSFVILMGVTAVAILQLNRIRNRAKLIYTGFFSSIAAFVLTLVVTVLEGQPASWFALHAAALNALWTFAAGFVMTGLLPFIERYFHVLTDIKLLELCDVSHPLLQELVRRAPSTYNHSITVAALAEAAADSIRARGLLVRVGAYFHDIGKMLKPEYFIENQPPDTNRHESLIPAMSTLVIIAHIKDGADLARAHKLPEAIIDFIEQHHGTTLMEFFYGRASEQSRADPNGGEVDENSFRYPGPRPLTKEACVLMLADSCESACRSLVDPAPSRIEGLVREITKRKLDDGQFDDSSLTLHELRTVQASLTKSLIANYHGRVKYPDQKTA